MSGCCRAARRAAQPLLPAGTTTERARPSCASTRQTASASRKPSSGSGSCEIRRCAPARRGAQGGTVQAGAGGVKRRRAPAQPECRVYLAMTKCDLLEDPPALGLPDAAASGSDDSAGAQRGLAASVLCTTVAAPAQLAGVGPRLRSSRTSLLCLYRSSDQPRNQMHAGSCLCSGFMAPFGHGLCP